MLYRFKSAATAEVILGEADGNQILTLIGKAPASRGTVTAEALPAAIAALEQAVAAEPATAATPATAGAEVPDPVGLRQRAWPMLAMLRRANAARVPVVWGV